jgi:uncharacterized protein YcfJ
MLMFLFAASGRELRRFNEIAVGLVLLSAALICQFTSITNTHIGRLAASPAALLAVRPARVTRREPPPRPLLRVVFLALEQQHVVAQQDQRIRAGAGAGDVAVVVHVAGRDQRRHIAAVQGALVRETQLGAAAGMADYVPVLMGLHPRTGAIATQQRWEWV